ncbi:hypothetical protein CYLTODRAFT_415441 [Cylindrobasidium torrendii FP15055 ss-10]|uniref:Uncharacterized protein n=1 Tax=Cylindrobasidium torrendii FP15055 ss-10 TaxID=1314674 RepID=A0A0D7AUA5_9AGAR|nr:hypothetical protein CYLTODRAFT_415441 [Cylindrobasidium torrendii FP15055 ss-10]
MNHFHIEVLSRTDAQRRSSDDAFVNFLNYPTINKCMMSITTTDILLHGTHHLLDQHDSNRRCQDLDAAVQRLMNTRTVSAFPFELSSEALDGLFEALATVRDAVEISLDNPHISTSALFSSARDTVSPLLCNRRFLRAIFHISLGILDYHIALEDASCFWGMRCMLGVSLLMALTQELRVTGTAHIIAPVDWDHLVSSVKAALVSIASGAVADPGQAFYVFMAWNLQDLHLQNVYWHGPCYAQQLPAKEWSHIVRRVKKWAWKPDAKVPLAVVMVLLQELECDDGIAVRETLEVQHKLIKVLCRCLHHLIDLEEERVARQESNSVHLMGVCAIGSALSLLASMTSKRTRNAGEVLRIIKHGALQAFFRITMTPSLISKVDDTVQGLLSHFYYQFAVSKLVSRRGGLVIEELLLADDGEMKGFWAKEWAALSVFVDKERQLALTCAIVCLPIFILFLNFLTIVQVQQTSSRRVYAEDEDVHNVPHGGLHGAHMRTRDEAYPRGLLRPRISLYG